MPTVPTPIRYWSSITEHIKKHFGKDYFVLHEKKSSIVHIDVYVVRSNEDRPYFTLITSGMSDLDRHVPEGVDYPVLAEACLCLPADWPLAMDKQGWREPKYFWPISVLKQAAKYPHANQTWLAWGHTIGDIQHPEPLDAAADFTGVIFLPPATFPEAAEQLQTEEDSRTILFLGLVPLRPQELTFRGERPGGNRNRAC
jgi:Suppressor of fused protein (SUFU)